MRCLQFSTAMLLFFAAGCRTPNDAEELPGYRVTVPADVPLQYMLQGKDGQQFVVDGHDEYRWGHREGWADCWRRHQKGQLDPRDESQEPVSMQETALAARARVDGFHECRRLIARSR